MGQVGTLARFEVTVPADRDGHIGRQCPGCGGHFRVSAADYEALPDHQDLWCVYCGHRRAHDQFVTRQQVNRAAHAAEEYAIQLVGQELDRTFSALARRTRGNRGIKITYRPEPFRLTPLPGLSEEGVIRERSCERCTLRYAVYGEHRYCPGCGPLSAVTVAADALSAERLRLQVLHGLPAESLRILREAGSLDRTYADTIENAVGIVEALADHVFHRLVPHAETVVRGKGNVFQRPRDFADLFRVHTDLDLDELVGDIWPEVEAIWAARHLFMHRDGIVDSKYLRVVPGWLMAGQRLQPTRHLAVTALDHAEQLCSALVGFENT
jgi:uncharacterized C2H2 Zn-finger protein